jgi:3-ketosteroid 9alpha-monooxygenase subunit B
VRALRRGEVYRYLMSDMGEHLGAAPFAAPAPAAPRRRRIRPYEATVASVIPETHDTVTLVLRMPERVEYLAGQFLTIDPHQFEELADLIAYLEDVKKKREPPRAYSMCSSPLERDVAVTVKEERYARGWTKYPPLLSPYLVRHAAPGQPMTVVGFTGAFVLPPDVERTADHVVHVVAGSGSVPNYAMLKHALAVHPRLRQTFVYSNKTWDDVIFRDGLTVLAREFPDRLRVVHTLTREADPARRGAGVRKGRITAELLAELIGDPARTLVYACGPAIGPHERARARERGEPPEPRFLETVTAALDRIGVPKERVKTEAYG